MENNKYFTPDIEDLHIGYECEIYAQCTDKLIRKVDWHPVKVFHSPERSRYVGILQCKKLIKTHHIKVPYLTKEQIEAEGWKFDYNLGDFDYYIKTVNDTEHELEFCYKERININKYKFTLYHGECKDINTFRKIIKLLEI